MTNVNKPGLKLGDNTPAQGAPKAVTSKPVTGNAPGNARAFGTFSTITATGVNSSGSPKEVLEHFTNVYGRIKNDSSTLPVQMFLISDNDLRIPSIVIYTVNKGICLYSTILLEGLGERLTNTTRNVHGQSIEIDRYAYMYWDERMQTVVHQLMENTLVGKGMNANAASAGAMVLPAAVEIVNPEIAPDNVAPYLDAAIQVLESYTRVSEGLATSTWTAEDLVGEGFKLVTRTDIAPGATYRDPYGSYVAHDFCITLSAGKRGNENRGIHDSGTETVVSKVVGMLDFAYRESQIAGYPQQWNQPVQREPLYDIVAVITDLSPLGGSAKSKDTLLTYLLGIMSLSTTLSNGRVFNIYNTVGTDSELKTSVGVLGLEHNIYKEKHVSEEIAVVAGDITGGPNGTLTVTQMLADYCNSTPIIAIDCVKGGPLEWLHSIIADCGTGSANESLIIKELDTFSGGIFSTLWDRSKPIVDPRTNVVLLGHYNDTHGNVRDIRGGHDYAATLQACQGDERIMMDYSEARTPGMSSELTLDKMRKQIKLRNPAVTFTGIAERCYLNVEFLNAMVNMFTSLGIELSTEGMSSVDVNARRGTTYAGMNQGTMTNLHDTYRPNAQPNINTFGPGGNRGGGLGVFSRN